jgi:hypothetical protein
VTRPLHTVVSVQLPNRDDVDARALALAVTYPQVAVALASIDFDAPRRLSTVRLAVSGLDPTTLALRAAEVVRTVIDRFHVHRERLLAGSTASVS